MPTITVHVSSFSPEQKARVGQKIIDAMLSEDLRPHSVLVLFRDEDTDFYTDGGPLVARPVTSAPVAPLALPPAVEPLRIAAPMAEAAGRTRRTRAQLSTLRDLLIRELQAVGSLSSFAAQKALGLEDEHAAGTLRRLFSELEEEGLVQKEGQKRGTRYVWSGPAAASGKVKLNGEAAEEVEEAEEAEEVPAERTPVAIDAEEQARIDAIMDRLTPDEGEA